MSDPDAIRERHKDCNPSVCLWYSDDRTVACDTHVVLDAWDELLADRNAILERLIEANGNADRLAAALRLRRKEPTSVRAGEASVEALRLHDEAKG